MAHLPPKSPTMAQKWPSCTYQTSPISATQPSSSWMDDFVDYSSARRNSHRRSTSDPIAFVETPFTNLNECRDPNGFERLDMFSDDFAANIQAMKSSSTDQNSDGEEPKSAPQKMKSEPGEVEDGGGYEHDSEYSANRQSAQRSRIRKLHYISELERSVANLQTEVSTLSPRVAFLDHQRLILNVDNSSLKQRIAALAQDKIFKDAHQEALKKEVERLRRVYHEQNMSKPPGNTTTATDSPAPPPPASVNGTDE
ncbi:hypothetical protein E3N88_08740 [Mikania micrantha]|uniref:BZIP domain-containing protein n=1 Tax=Mikania micrantha TaxID=192012 RepID=A0A5N6PH58_9ASTR|nr:hypothetical protein E3N88_08740 [Mikania micrantha]